MLNNLMSMIPVNEWRIGNWHKNLIGHRKMDSFLFHELYDHEENDDYSFPDHIDPIRLTPELLVKCGFDESEVRWGNKIYYTNDRSALTHRIINKDTCFYYAINGEFITSYQLKYLHQLQNLYFALTGKELEVNLTEILKTFS